MLPVIFLWWWWVGTRFDFGLFSGLRARRPKMLVAILFAIAIVLLFVGMYIIGDQVRLWRVYGAPHPFLLVKTIVSTLWSLAIAGGSFLAGLRLIQQRLPVVAERVHRPSILAYGFVIAVLTAVTVSLVGYARETKVDLDSCVSSSDAGCIHGIVTDVAGRLIEGIEIEVLPSDKTGETRWYAKKGAFSDRKGRYSIQLGPGDYFVAVHYYSAPDARRPFTTTFYPGVEAEGDAVPVSAVRNSPTILQPLRLRSLTLATIEIEVIWPDGTRPERSNLLFHNVSYPDQAVIGDEAPQIDKGSGEFILPKGFSYLARASVQCDAGQTIETRESRPVQRIDVGQGVTPTKLKFVISGPTCKLWNRE
jgi:hypothetical protein